MSKKSKLTTLVAALVIGSSSVALADHPTQAPSVVPDPSGKFYGDRFDDSRFGGRYDDRFDDRFDDDRFDRNRGGRRWYDDFWWNRRGMRDDAGPRRYRTSWVALSTPVQLTRGRDVIDIRDRGTFTQLRVQTTHGQSYLRAVMIRFKDGSRQIARLDHVLDVRSPMVEISLDGNNRRIEEVIVVGDSRRNAAVQVFGI